MCVPEVLHMRATAREFNDATKYSPFCELFFFLVRRETNPTDPVPHRHVSTESFRYFTHARCTAFCRKSRERSSAAGNGLIRATPMVQEQALRGLHAQGLHALGLSPLKRTSD